MNVGIALAFVAGILTFFAGCLIPVLPAYIGYLGGLSASSTMTQAGRPFWLRPIFLNSLIFCLGFITIFSLLGLTASTVGNQLGRNREEWEKLGGIFLILLAIYNAEVVKLTSLFKSWQIRLSPRLAHTRWGAFLLGLTFGFAWTPCIGPTLATILFLASTSTSYWYGVTLLLVFGLGLSVPFIALGIAAQWLQPHLVKFNRWSTGLRWISSAIMLIVGVLLLTGHIGWIAHYFLQLSESIVI